MDKATARSIILNGHLKTAPIKDCPWPELATLEGGTDIIIVREFSGDESMAYQDETNMKKAMGFAFANCILWAEDRTPVMQQLDYEQMLKTNGVSFLLPLINQIVELSGLGPNAVQDAKNASQQTQESASTTN